MVYNAPIGHVSKTWDRRRRKTEFEWARAHEQLLMHDTQRTVVSKYIHSERTASHTPSRCPNCSARLRRATKDRISVQTDRQSVDGRACVRLNHARTSPTNRPSAITRSQFLLTSPCAVGLAVARHPSLHASINTGVIPLSTPR